MRKVVYLVAAIAILMVSCKESYKKTTDGMEYKIISDGKGAKLAVGNYFEISYKQTYKGKSKDTVLGVSTENGNQLAVLDSTQIPPAYFKIFTQVRKGDSIIIRQLTDSIMKTQSEGLPPFFRKGDMVVAGYKVVNIYTTREQADSANKAIQEFAKANNYKKTIVKIEQDLVKNAAQLKTDDAIIQSYLTANNITATKTAWGTYVAITTPGTGNNLDKNSYAVVNYTGKTLKDTVFDSNVDKAFNHVEPYNVPMNEFNVIPGWIDGLQKMNKGSKGKLIIPSSLAYGVQGREPKIGSNEILVFDIEVVDVLTKQQYDDKITAERNMMIQKQMEMQAKQQKDHPAAPQEQTAPPAAAGK